MAKILLAVYAASHVYLERFVSFASGARELGFQVQGFTDLLLLGEYLQKRKADALLLVLEEESKQAFHDHHELIALLNRLDSIVIMMGRQSGCEEWEAFFREEGYEDRIRYINRYQSAVEILTYVRQFFPEDQRESPSGKDRSLPWLAGMYSPVDKVCHPQAAAAIMKGKRKVLYINLEQFSGIPYFSRRAFAILLLLSSISTRSIIRRLPSNFLKSGSTIVMFLLGVSCITLLRNTFKNFYC